jgi:Predicted membrane protein
VVARDHVRRDRGVVHRLGHAVCPQGAQKSRSLAHVPRWQSEACGDGACRRRDAVHGRAEMDPRRVPARHGPHRVGPDHPRVVHGRALCGVLGHGADLRRHRALLSAEDRFGVRRRFEGLRVFGHRHRFGPRGAGHRRQRHDHRHHLKRARHRFGGCGPGCVHDHSVRRGERADHPRAQLVELGGAHDAHFRASDRAHGAQSGRRGDRPVLGRADDDHHLPHQRHSGRWACGVQDQLGAVVEDLLEVLACAERGVHRLHGDFGDAARGM